jgi:hypothetical protein
MSDHWHAAVNTWPVAHRDFLLVPEDYFVFACCVAVIVVVAVAEGQHMRSAVPGEPSVQAREGDVAAVAWVVEEVYPRLAGLIVGLVFPGGVAPFSS